MYQAIVTYSDGTTVVLPLQEEKTPQGFRVVLAKESITKPAEFVDFMVGYAPAQEGEAGYIVYNNYMITFHGHENEVLDTGYCWMPLLGVKTPRECFACIVTGLWEQHSFIIQCKDGVYTAHPRFRLDGQAVEDDMQVDYCLLTGAEADYSGMAKVYRERQLTVGGCKLIRDRMNPNLAYALNAPEIRMRLAWKPVPTPVEEQTPETEPPMHVAATFERVGQVMDACKAHGVDKAEFCLVGWNIKGHDGRWPQMFPVEKDLGGEEKLRALTQKAKDMGYHMVCHTNSTDCYSISNRWSEDLPMRTRDGKLQKNAQWGGGRMYNMCPKAGGEAFAYEDLPRLKELGFDGIHYIDVISCVRPYRCFSEKHPCTPKEFIASMRRIAKFASQEIGGFQSEGAYDYTAAQSDMYLYVDFGLFKKPSALVDANIPLWQLIYHGIILSNPAPATVNYPVKDWQSQLKFVEYGGHPAIYIHSKFHGTHNWMGDDDLTCGSPEEIEATAAAIRKVVDDYEAVKDLQTETMAHHDILGDLTVTAYEGGTRVVCNYGETAQAYAGVSVAPHGYAVIRP